jgi:carbamoyltransferase
MITVAIHVGNHDRNITILDNEKLLAIIQEDRISRIKYDSSFPLVSLDKILDYTKVIDNLIIVNTSNSSSSYEFIISYLKKKFILIHNVIVSPKENHHIFHAASSFYQSGFKDATCITIDSFGGSTPIPDTQNQVCFDTTNIYNIEFPNTFIRKYRNLYYNPFIFDKVFSFDSIPNSTLNSSLDIGMIYDSITTHLGFNNLDSGKVMGLSSYGKINSKLPSILYEESIYGNMNLFNNDAVLNIELNPNLKNLNPQDAQDLAYSVQKALEKVFIYRIKQALTLSPSKNIVISGGCSLNVVNNYKLEKEFPDINFYFDPIGNDSGQSYGAAKYYYYQLTNSTTLEPLKHLYHGPKYNKENLLNSIKKYV